jgi:two-component system chemotaxis response regulator CheB
MSTERKSQALSVLAVDDSALYRKILKDVVSEIAGVEFLGTAQNGRMAIEKIRQLQPGVVLLDVEMPEMNGLETLEVIHREFPDIGVVMISGVGKQAADITVSALEMGALDFITKPDGKSFEINHKTLVDRLSPILWTFNTKRTLANVRRKHQAEMETTSPETLQKEIKPVSAPVQAQAQAQAPAATKPDVLKSSYRPLSVSSAPRIDVVAIGISTGGPNALGVMIPAIPQDLGVPILIVQHMPPVFTASLAKSLEKKSKVGVVEASEGQAIQPNTVYIAPGGKHMVVRRDKETGAHITVGLNENPPENSCRPAVDVLFRSVAGVFGANVLAVIMTGMGQDGLNGVKMLKQRGCWCLTQDEETCTIYGMPMAVFKAGLSDESVPLQYMAERITHITRRLGI